ncbi:MAG: zinc carboxypeptidase [Actinophytocola sp.]|nr:zinc carboxypeptidase [Actinophytocola sp.]
MRGIAVKLPVVIASSLLVAAIAVAAPAQAEQPQGELDVYTAEVTSAEADELARQEHDIIATRHVGSRMELDVVLDDEQRDRLEQRGVKLEVKRNRDGKSSKQLAEAQAANGYDVWRSWDEPGGIRDELYDIAKKNPQLAKLKVLGTSHQGREIIGLKLTQSAREVPDGSRPAVLYSATQHAREWISTEVNRRTLHHFIDRWRANDKEIKNLLKSTELWFVLVANPDGYQYTFDNERLWRKNLRDNDGDGQVSSADGVDPNRNFDEHFGYDEEGSSSQFASQTYRGPSPASEPETVAMQGLLDSVKPKFQSNWHSFGEWILYPQGWQIGTPDADNPLYVAMAGTDEKPAIEGFDPGISSDELYVTNGETTDYADVNNGTIAFTPELGEGTPGSGFVFPDDETLIQAEFQKTLPFSLGLAKSATDPENPESPVDVSVDPFYLTQAEIDQENTPLSMFDFTFDESYGDPQEVRVLAKKSLGDVTLNYRVNGGDVQTKPTGEWTGGETYGVGNAEYYQVVSGEVTGTDPGDSVEVWFTGGGEQSESFTYDAVSESGDPVLVMAAEDYTGASPNLPAGPQYLEYYTEALDANGVGHDVYDVDAKGRTAPDPLGVLAHYDAVIWYTGDDIVTREAGWGPGNASSLAMTELLAVRDYLNEGGRVLYTGKWAGQQYTTNVGTQMYDPFNNAQCSDPAVAPGCRPLPGSGDVMGDVLQYWFGAGIANLDAGINPETGEAYDVVGSGEPFDGQSWSLNGADSAQNQDTASSFITTSGLLPVEQFPQFESWAAAKYDRPGGPFDPHSGEHYVYSQIGDVSYKRLTRTVSVPADGGELSFWTSYNTEADWDHLAVEARTAGQDDWTTLPDLNGHTSQAPGDSCSSGWRELHPHLDHYQTLNPDGSCDPAGTTGEWHAASGGSGGWQQWRVDLADYAGQDVEISIAYISDWSVQGLGVFLDDIATPAGDGDTDFEAGLDGWEITGPPEGSSPNPNNFERTTAGGFPEGAAVATEDTLYLGFGFEGISDGATRNAVMGSALQHLLP